MLTTEALEDLNKLSFAKILTAVCEFLVYSLRKIPYVVRCCLHRLTCVNMWRNVSYGPRPRNKLDVYFPDPSLNIGRFGNGVILLVHGGAWYWGSKIYFSRVQRNSFPDCTVVVINYTLHPEGQCDVMVVTTLFATRFLIFMNCTFDQMFTG